MKSIRVTGLIGIIAITGWAMNAQAQKVYATDNATSSLNAGWAVRVFDNGAYKYIIDDDHGVLFSPRGVAFDSTGSVYVMHLIPPSNLPRVEKFTENPAGTDVFVHSQVITTYGGIGGNSPCNWGIGDARRIDIDLSDDTVLVADAGGVWNTTCSGSNSAPGGRGPGSYGVILKFPGVGGSVIDPTHTRAIGVQGMAWHNHSGGRTPQAPGIHIDQSNGDVYVGSGWNSDPAVSSQQVQRFSSALVELSRFDVNVTDPNLDTRTNKADGGSIAVNHAGEVWVADHMLNPGMGGWGSPMGRLTKYDSSGNILATKIGTTVISGSTRNNFGWGGGLDVDEANVLWFGDADRIIRLDGVTGDFLNYPMGDTAGQSDTNIYGEGAFVSNTGSIEQLAVGPLPPVGSVIRVQ